MAEQHVSERSLKWYDIEGNPIYQVPSAKGDKMVDCKLTQARKKGLYPSWGSVITDTMGKPYGLEVWWNAQLVTACINNPKEPAESPEEYSARMVQQASVFANEAADRGTELHAYVEQFIADHGIYGQAPLPEDIAARAMIQELRDFCDREKIYKLVPEKSLIDPLLGFGATPDIVGENDKGEITHIIDLKTTAQKRKPYLKEKITLNAYAQITGAPESVKLFNMISNRDTGESEFPESQLDHIKTVFLVYELWTRTNSQAKEGGYDPREFEGERWTSSSNS